ncbi:hypothetical protein C2G38_2113022 [Gigaspora rosea]|uniref:Uncharacterized protein n=1 Tax=Gigaspora rosea TaxID=44941 RepID=A0A397UFX7_9GLOM|nr:hypothetical protein C2G38_2113022 [Gigaspora rosea]
MCDCQFPNTISSYCRIVIFSYIYELWQRHFSHMTHKFEGRPGGFPSVFKIEILIYRYMHLLYKKIPVQ